MPIIRKIASADSRDLSPRYEAQASQLFAAFFLFLRSGTCPQISFLADRCRSGCRLVSVSFGIHRVSRRISRQELGKSECGSRARICRFVDLGVPKNPPGESNRDIEHLFQLFIADRGLFPRASPCSVEAFPFGRIISFTTKNQHLFLPLPVIPVIGELKGESVSRRLCASCNFAE